MVPADIVLIAAGFLGSEDYVTGAFGVSVNARGNVTGGDGEFGSGSERVFAAGDMHIGQSLVVRAIAQGREAALEVDKSLLM